MPRVSTDITTPTLDLLDPDWWRTRQHEFWTWARANQPVPRDERSGIWCVTRHADVQHVERQDEVFSSLRTYRLNETPGVSPRREAPAHRGHESGLTNWVIRANGAS